jgi:uncharacterized protein (DUF58 family)
MSKPQSGAEVEGERRSTIYVLPNRNSLGLLALLGAMWYAGASQTNGAAYLLCFVLLSVALVSSLHTWRNLRGIFATAGQVRAVFAGEDFRVPVRLRTVDGRARFGIRVSGHGSPAVIVDELSRGASESVELLLPPVGRGRYEQIPVRLSSHYPLGFFTAWTDLKLSQVHFIYPKASGALPLPESLSPANAQREGLKIEGDDFAGVRAYQLGESQRHIDWKAAARGQPLLIKQWAGSASETVSLSWSNVAHLGEEARLSQLARWVIVAERKGLRYGLELPGIRLGPENGTSHYHACLRALAAFSVDSGNESGA